MSQHSASPCAYPPVGSCGNKTTDPSGFCYHHRMIVNRAKNGFTEITHSALRSSPKMLTDDNEVEGVPDDALPRFVRHHGDPDGLTVELKEHLTESEMSEVEMSRDGAKIPDSYHDRVADQESSTEPDIETGSAEAADHTAAEAESDSPAQESVDAADSEGTDSPAIPIQESRFRAKKRFPKSHPRDIDSMLDQWEGVFEEDPDLASRWESLDEESQMRIIGARLESQKDVNQMPDKRRHQSNDRYLRRSIRSHRPMGRTLARIDSSSRAAWMAPYDISDSIVSSIGGFFSRLTRH